MINLHIGNRANLAPEELDNLERRGKALEIAQNLLDLLDDETISQRTGLSLDEVKQLR